jgi:hypothetical protein
VEEEAIVVAAFSKGTEVFAGLPKVSDVLLRAEKESRLWERDHDTIPPLSYPMIKY